MPSILEPEETVGTWWHRLVGEAESYPRHPEAAVTFEQVRGALMVFFHVLGGDPGLRLAAGAPRDSGHRLSLRYKLGFVAVDREAVIDIFACDLELDFLAAFNRLGGKLPAPLMSCYLNHLRRLTCRSRVSTHWPGHKCREGDDDPRHNQDPEDRAAPSKSILGRCLLL